MFCDLAIGHAENIDPNHGLRSPSDIAAMNHDIVTIGHHDTGLVFEIGRQVLQNRLDRRCPVWNLRIMLLIVVAEQTVQNGRVAIDENAPSNRPTTFLSCAKWYAPKLFVLKIVLRRMRERESGMEAFIMLCSLCVILLATAACR